MDKYDTYKDCGKIYFYMARSLELMEMHGQAIDAYQLVIDTYSDQQCNEKEGKTRVEKSRIAINNLKKF